MKEPTVSDAHPELHHYTNWGGLKGIMTSGTVWGTHYEDLNDYTEIEHLKSHLVQRSGERIRRYLLDTKKVDRDFGRKIRVRRRPIFKLAPELAEAAVDSLYQVTFKGFEGPPFANPFIASFCAHTSDQEYEQKNGLLSQWRGYGGEESYAIVFDTGSLEKLLTEESASYQYSTSSFFDVIYDAEDRNYQELFHDLEEQVRRMSVEMFCGGEPELGEVYSKFVLLASRVKHRGFSEEREVRILANPQTEEMDAYLKTEAPDEYVPRPEQFKEMFRCNGKRHIALFDAGSRLPVNRIIVGPHRDKYVNQRKVRQLVGQRTTVQISQTPYIA